MPITSDRQTYEQLIIKLLSCSSFVCYKDVSEKQQSFYPLFILLPTSFDRKVPQQLVASYNVKEVIFAGVSFRSELILSRFFRIVSLEFCSIDATCIVYICVF